MASKKAILADIAVIVNAQSWHNNLEMAARILDIWQANGIDLPARQHLSAFVGGIITEREFFQSMQAEIDHLTAQLEE